MKKIHIKKIIYHIRHNYVTLNNIVIAAAFLIAASWVWASLAAMQRNYSLQRGIDYKKQELGTETEFLSDKRVPRTCGPRFTRLCISGRESTCLAAE
jgi:hypothetical protein